MHILTVQHIASFGKALPQRLGLLNPDERAIDRVDAATNEVISQPEFLIHRYKEVTNRPASHGCVRVLHTGDNPAKRFHEWVEIGSPASISGRWEQ